MRRSPECQRLGGVEACLQPFGPPRIDGVDAIVPLQSKLGRSLARFSEANGVERPQAHPPWAAVQHESENPVARPVSSDAQIKTATIGIHAGVFLLVHLKRGERAD